MSAKLEHKAAYEASPRGFLHRQLFEHPSKLPDGLPLDGQTIIVTGSNSGVGFEACKQLISLGVSKLILAVRSETKGKGAMLKLQETLQQSSLQAELEVWELDMASYDSITAFVSRCEAELPRIDTVLLNAGLRSTKFSRHPQTGHESSLQVNYFGTALLATLLVPVLRAKKSSLSKGSPPRICIVSSDTVYMAKLDESKSPIKQLDEEENYRAIDWYPKTKLLILMFVAELARKVDPNDVIISCTNPGMTYGTSFDTDTGSRILNNIAAVVKRLIGRSPAVGASAYLDSIINQGRTSHGSFTSDWTIKP